VLLTDSGRDYAARVADIMRDADETAMSGMDAAERERLRSSLRKVIENLQA